jgi:predicted phosphodiesterase
LSFSVFHFSFFVSPTAMRYLVLSDIHANIDALDAVLEVARGEGFDRAIVLGDLVGYGAEPNLVVERIRALDPVAVIRGNHDKVAAGIETADGFNPTAQRAAAWTRDALSEESRNYLRDLPEGPVAIDSLTLACHGSPADEDTYIVGEADVVEALTISSRPVCLFGHTHLPMAAALTSDRMLDVIFHGTRERRTVHFEDSSKYLVNPGSVGQPRDGDPRASYGLLDTDARRIDINRAAYPVQQANDRIVAAGLPAILGHRLTLGR